MVFLCSDIDSYVKKYLKIFNSLRNKLKWKAQNQLLMMIALLYVINEKEFNFNEFIDLSRYIKSNAGFFSPLHSHQRFSISAMLLTKYDNPKDKFHELIKYQERLTSNGFKKGPFTNISALSLMVTHDTDEDLNKRILKAFEIYKGMKSYHYFLTSQSDYPLAILLSKLNKPIDDLLEEVEFYYSKLSEGNFKNGNDLQFLSHILMLADLENKDFIVNKCNNIYENLIEEGLKVKRLHYSLVGLMSIVDKNLETEIKEIKDIFNILNTTKHLKRLKDINLIMAVLMVISKVIKNIHDDISIIETGLNTSIETIIQAQNAALISSITVTSTTASTIQ